jgi:hypothetical protein
MCPGQPARRPPGTTVRAAKQCCGASSEALPERRPGGRIYLATLGLDTHDAPLEARLREMIDPAGDGYDVLVTERQILAPLEFVLPWKEGEDLTFEEAWGPGAAPGAAELDRELVRQNRSGGWAILLASRPVPTGDVWLESLKPADRRQIEAARSTAEQRVPVPVPRRLPGWAAAAPPLFDGRIHTPLRSPDPAGIIGPHPLCG